MTIHTLAAIKMPSTMPTKIEAFGATPPALSSAMKFFM